MKKSLAAVSIVAATVLASSAGGWADSNSQMAEAQLATQHESGVTGVARLHLVGSELTVEVFADGLAPDSVHAEHVHAGSCQPGHGTIVFDLPDLHANDGGQAHSKKVFDGVSSIPSSGWYVNIHTDSTDSSAGIACGNVTA